MDVARYDWAVVAGQVKYTDELHFLDHPEMISVDDITDTSELSIAKYILNLAQNYWYHKGIEWQYENEYRIMMYTNEDGPIEIDIINSLKSIVFGEKVSTLVKEVIGKYCWDNNIEALAVNFDEYENKYKIYKVG